MSGLLTILVALLVFAIMVTVHEFGHFAVAKLFKIHVVEFAVGMGPAFFKKKHGDTTYALRWIPFGGYCMFDNDVGDNDAPNAFEKAAWWKRLCVALAGAFLNLVLGFLVFIVLQSANATTYQPTVTDFVTHTYAESSDLQVGDKILRLNDTGIHIKDDLDLFMQRNGAAPVQVTVKRGKETKVFTITPSKSEEIYTYGETEMSLVQNINGNELERIVQPAPDIVGYADYVGQTTTVSRYILGFYGETKPHTFLSVLRDAFFTTIYNVKIVYISLWDMLLGKVSADQVSGPIGIVSVIGQATKVGWQPLLALVGLLTVNLGIMNLLPIPALDGCKALVLIAEGITRKKLPPKVEGIINFAGFALLILLMLWATFNDIQNIFIQP